jgi:uncharacterized protein with HEPN domain
MSKELRDTDYLQHMLQAIERINRYVHAEGENGFQQDTKTQDAVIRNIEIIGEAANRVSAEFAAKHDEIPWQDIAGMRHRLVHGYFQVNLSTVWNVVARELPGFEVQIRVLLQEPNAQDRRGR